MGGMRDLTGRLAVVTGAANGIGRATALALAAKGARVMALDVDVEGADATATACIRPGGPTAEGHACDIADADAVEALAKTMVADHGPPAVLVNNAGIGMSGTFLDTPLDAWESIVGVNLMGVVHGCRFFGGPMAEAGAGQVFNLSSGLGFVATPEQPAYCSTKAAVLSLSRSLRADWGPRGVGVTAVCPGVVDTGITERTRFFGDDADRDQRDATEGFRERAYPPEKVAAAIVRAVGRNPAVITPSPEARLARVLGRVAPERAGMLARRAAERRRRSIGEGDQA